MKPPRTTQASPTVLDIGPVAQVKTAEILSEYQRALWESEVAVGRRALWIAPSRAAAAAVRDRLVEAGDALLDPGVTTFGGFAADVLREAGLNLRVISSLERRRLVGRLIAAAAAENRLRFFGPVAHSPGLAATLEERIADLERRDVPPSGLRELAQRAGDPRTHDLSELYVAYRDRLRAARLVDADALLAKARDALASSLHLAGKLRLVVIDGFSHFTSVQHDLITILSQRSARLWITLPGEIDGDAGRRADLFARPAATASLLGSSLERVGLRSEEASRWTATSSSVGSSLHRSGGVRIEYASSDRACPALAHVERNLFRMFHDLEPVSPQAAASLDRLHIVAACGLQAEIDEIARRVKRLLLAGAAPGDVVVAFRSPRDVADRVRQAFDDFGIPLWLDAERRLAAAPTVRSLLGVLRVAAEDWPYRRVLQVVQDRSLGWVEAGDWDTKPQTAAGGEGPMDVRSAIELCVRYAQLPSGRRALLGQLALWGDDDEGSVPGPRAARLAADALGQLSRWIELLPKRADVDGWIGALGLLAERLGLLRPATGETAANWSILERSLRSAARIDVATGWADEELSLREFVELIASVADLAHPARDHDAIGRVLVLSAEAARLVRPKHLLIGGLSEQSFPAARRTDAAVLDDGSPEESAAALRSDEMLLFYQLVMLPTETLTLSYPALDERGQTLPASPFLIELERAFGNAAIPRTTQSLSYERAERDTSPLSRRELRRTAVARALARDRHPLAVFASSDVDAGRGIAHSILAGIESIADRARRDHFGPFEGVVASEAASAWLNKEFGAEHLWSPSRLEQYAECPFRFFGEQVLHLQAAPELALACDVRRRGSVLHETLAQLYSQFRGEHFDAEQVAGALATLFQETLSAVTRSRPGRGLDAALREIERRQIAAWADSFAKQDGEYRAAWSHLDAPPAPTHFEARFGPGGGPRDNRTEDALSTDTPFALPVTIDGAVEPVQFIGQIDRIDVGRVGKQLVFNVIDYKTNRRAAVDEEEIHAGRQVQLALYAMAAEQLLFAGQQATPLTAGYWSILGKGYGMKGKAGPLAINTLGDSGPEPAATWFNTRDKLTTRIGEIIAAIRRGEFPVFNPDEQCTKYCDLRTICRIAQVRALEKQCPAAARSAPQTPRRG
jgi:ATP-dependent helicase/DNAse subunit B